jgi:DNA-binding LacI/PurR family transcriptional regulator
MLGAESLPGLLAKAPLLQPTFTKLLRERSISAWICANDDLALLAWEFLRHQRGTLHVPSVVGFDNTPEANAVGLTSHDFRYDAMGLVAARWLQTPSAVTRRARDRFIVPGVLVCRDSLCPGSDPMA